MTPTRTARCCCGDATITVDGEPVFNALCHCGSCKRRTGSAFGWSVYFPDTAVRARGGETRTYAKSGDMPFARTFCARCGTTLWWKSETFMPDYTGVAGGCFVDDPMPDPMLSASEGQRCSWVSLPAAWMTTP